MSVSDRVVIFGGAGFIGSHLTEELVRAGRPVRVFDKTRGDWTNLAAVRDRVELLEGDFLNEVDVRGALAGCGAAVHLVSATLPSTSNDNPVYDVEANVVASLRFLEAARDAGVRRIVFISSGGTVYGPAVRLPIDETHPTEPTCSYGIGKLAIEKYLGLWRRLYGLEDTVLRLSNPYGERQNPAAAQGAVAVFLGRVLRGEPIDIWGDGSVVRDYLYIGDAARAIRLVLENPPAGRVFNVGSGVGTSLNELVDAIRRVTGRPVRVNHGPPRPVDVPANVLDGGRLREAVGWRADTPLDDGLARTWRWLEAPAARTTDIPPGDR
jgi:UDP-glucose 4-epimerase